MLQDHPTQLVCIRISFDVKVSLTLTETARDKKLSVIYLGKTKQQIGHNGNTVKTS